MPEENHPALLVLATLHPGMSLRKGPIPLEVHRAHVTHPVVTVRIAKTTCIGVGATDEEALEALRCDVAIWVRREGPRYQRGELGKGQVAVWRVLREWVAADPEASGG